LTQSFGKSYRSQAKMEEDAFLTWMIYDSVLGDSHDMKPNLDNDEVLPSLCDPPLHRASDFQLYNNFWVHRKHIKLATYVHRDGKESCIYMYAPKVEILENTPAATLLAFMEIFVFNHAVDVRHPTSEEEVWEEVRPSYCVRIPRFCIVTLLPHPLPHRLPLCCNDKYKWTVRRSCI